MTLKSICQDAADEIGITQPSTIISNTDGDALKLLRYANKVGKRLMKIFPWQVLTEEQTFTGISGETQTGILPSDFDRFIPETFWDRTNNQLVVGPIGSVEWQGLKSFGYTGTPIKFRLRGGSILMIPALSSGESLAFEYVSKNWCQSSGGTGQAVWAVDTDTGVLDEELITRGVIWEFLVSEGLPSDIAAGAYEEFFEVLIDNDQPSAQILVAGDIFEGRRHFSGAPVANGTGLPYNY